MFEQMFGQLWYGVFIIWISATQNKKMQISENLRLKDPVISPAVFDDDHLALRLETVQQWSSVKLFPFSDAVNELTRRDGYTALKCVIKTQTIIISRKNIFCYRNFVNKNKQNKKR